MYGVRQIVIFAVWWGLCVPPYLVVLLLFFARRTRQPIRARSPLLLLCSAISGFVLLSYMASRNLFDSQIPCPTTYYVGVTLFVLYIVPYLLRCYRLMGIFDLTLAKVSLAPESSFSSTYIPPSLTLQQHNNNGDSNNNGNNNNNNNNGNNNNGNNNNGNNNNGNNNNGNNNNGNNNDNNNMNMNATGAWSGSEEGYTSTTTTAQQQQQQRTMSRTMSRGTSHWDFQEIIKKRGAFTEPRLLKILCALMVWLVIILGVVHAILSGSYLQSGTSTCDVTERYIILGLVAGMMCLVLAFVFLIYMMRRVTDGFSINNELKMVCGVALVHVTLALWLQSTSEYSWPSVPYVGYVTASLVLFCIAISVIFPLIKSFTRVTSENEFKLPPALPESTSTGSVVQAQFVTFLLDNVARKWFQEFLINEFSVENILFWAEVQEYKLLSTQDELNTTAAKIFEKYIVEGSPFQVNVSHESVQHTRENLNYENVNVSAFDMPEEEIMISMKGDAYPRFQRSPFYVKMIKEMKQKNLDLHVATAAQLL